MSTNPGAYPPAPAPRKSNVLLWILVAIGGLFLIGFAAIVGGGFYIAHKVKNIADMHDGKLVLKNDGKDVVISSSRKGSDGSLEIKSAEGTMKLGAGSDAKVPNWVPVYPGVDTHGVFSLQTKEGSSGSYSFKTPDSEEKVARFYEDEFKSADLKITSSVQTGQGQMITAEDENKKHTATVMIGSSNGETSAAVTYVQH